jgi:DNA-binding transcriptional LysR family regulator
MDQLHLMTVYIAVAEEQGFSAAARRLNMSPPAVTRAISTLEEKLGIKLLIRSTRHVRVTEAGTRYLIDSRKIVQAVEQANEAALGINAQPKGHLTVTAPVLFGQKYVMPGIVEYLNTYPETQVDAVFLDRIVNLLEEGFDAGIRIGHLPDSNMYATTVGHVRAMLVASPDYLQINGIPKNPDDLQNHTLIASSAGSMTHDWQFSSSSKKVSQILRIKPRLTITSNQAAINAAKQGLGITRIISYQVADELECGELQPVLAGYELPPIPVHIVHREGRMASNKVRCFIDLMAKRLRADKMLN